MIKNRAAVEHYRWGGVSEGWRLLDGADLSVIEERMPAGAAEVEHRHHRARQLFYVLAGLLHIQVGDVHARLHPGDACEVPPGQFHHVRNEGAADVVFLVISAPSTRGDREQMETLSTGC